MTYFYLCAALIVMVAVLFACYPLIKIKLSSSSSKAAVTSGELSNTSVIKQRIRELENEVNEGLIDADEKENAIRDLKLALVSETPEQAQSFRKNTSSLLIVSLALPAIAIGAWVYWQSNQLSGLAAYKASNLEVEDLRKKLEQQGPESLTPDDFAKFALSLRSSLRDNPDDVRGWSFLAMVNTSIGRVDEGLAAYKKALDITPQDDALRFKYAEALMLQGSEESLNNSARQLSYLVQKQPDNGNNRLLLTSVAIQLQNPELAVSQFVLIKDKMNSNSQFYQTIVTELRKLGVNDVSIVGEASIPDTLNNAVASNKQQDSSMSAGALASTTKATSNDVKLLVNVNISEAIKSKLPSEAYLIVFAQNSESGSRAPLAVKRFALPSLPVTVGLSDSDAMIPAMNLSSANTVNITARISLDDDVMPSSGELEGNILNVNLAQQTPGKALVIDVIVDKVL